MDDVRDAGRMRVTAPTAPEPTLPSRAHADTGSGATPPRPGSPPQPATPVRVDVPVRRDVFGRPEEVPARSSVFLTTALPPWTRLRRPRPRPLVAVMAPPALVPMFPVGTAAVPSTEAPSRAPLDPAYGRRETARVRPRATAPPRPRTAAHAPHDRRPAPHRPSTPADAPAQNADRHATSSDRHGDRAELLRHRREEQHAQRTEARERQARERRARVEARVHARRERIREAEALRREIDALRQERDAARFAAVTTRVESRAPSLRGDAIDWHGSVAPAARPSGARWALHVAGRSGRTTLTAVLALLLATALTPLTTGHEATTGLGSVAAVGAVPAVGAVDVAAVDRGPATAAGAVAARATEREAPRSAGPVRIADVAAGLDHELPRLAPATDLPAADITARTGVDPELPRLVAIRHAPGSRGAATSAAGAAGASHGTRTSRTARTARTAPSTRTTRRSGANRTDRTSRARSRGATASDTRSTSADDTSSSRARSRRGWSWPVAGGRISRGYRGRHHALDIAAPSGTSVYAARSGRVLFSGWKDNGGGWQVWLSHGANVYTTYNHMLRTLVRRGERVQRGERIGRVGSTGNSTGPHLHFEIWFGRIWDGGQRIDPLRYVRQ